MFATLINNDEEEENDRKEPDLDDELKKFMSEINRF
jgi:hypothetical protein